MEESDSESEGSASVEEQIPLPLESDDESADDFRGSSRLFSPYRTLGIVSSGAPFDVVPNDHSGNSLVCIPIGNRFQIMKTDRLQPVLVSQSVEGDIEHCLADASMSITVVSHGSRISLFRRTKIIHSKRIASKGWLIKDLIRLGKFQGDCFGEKEGKKENALAFVAVLAKATPDETDEQELAGNDTDEESITNEEASHCGEIVLFVATRTRIILKATTRLDHYRPHLAIHPSTYVNKILVAAKKERENAMLLINVVSRKIIHIFDCLTGSDEVTAFEQAPALDTMAVGTASGFLYLVNLKYDKRLFHFAPPVDGVAIQSISFRTDSTALKYGIAAMSAGLRNGTIVNFNLADDSETGRGILSDIKDAHAGIGGVSKIYFFPQEPLLLSCGKASNSIKLYIFDDPSHKGRLLKERSGHWSPPSCIRFLHGTGAGGILANAVDGADARGYQLLSGGGNDRALRVSSIVRSVLDKELGQGEGLSKKARNLGTTREELLLPPILDLSVCEAQNDWGDIVTIHKDHSFGYVWSSKRGAQSGPVLRQPGWSVSDMKVPPPSSSNATCVTMSACGSFAIVGTRGGTIYRYNVQSGRSMGSYPPNKDESSKRKRKERAGDLVRTTKLLEKKSGSRFMRPANKDLEEKSRLEHERVLESVKRKLTAASHSGSAVSGIAVDALNKEMFSVGTDSKLIVWDFETQSPHSRSPFFLPCPATKLSYARDSQLAAIALDDFSCLIFDTVAKAVVRRIGNSEHFHSGPISDLSFSMDGRNLFTGSLDRTIRVWDIPTSSCIDYLGFWKAPTSLSISPTGEFIATTHAGERGISIWIDRSFYQSVDTREVPSDPIQMDAPTPFHDASDSKTSVANVRMVSRGKDEVFRAEEVADESELSVTPKEAGLLTTSNKPLSHWKTLFHLELVKERNKPSELPKKPEKAPFFLQWRPAEPIASVSQTNDDTEGDQDNDRWLSNWSDNDESVDEKRRTSKIRSLGTSGGQKAKVLPSESRSKLAVALSSSSSTTESITRYMLSLGPSRVDLELASLCGGDHDLLEGLPLLKLASDWLCQLCTKRENVDATLAFVQRFLSLHATTIINASKSQERDDALLELLGFVKQLEAHQKSVLDSERLKFQHSIAMIKHLSRMV